MKIVALKVNGNNWDRGHLARPRNINQSYSQSYSATAKHGKSADAECN
jgi:hypothetical protein